MKTNTHFLMIGFLALGSFGMAPPRVLFEDGFAGQVADGWRWLRPESEFRRFRDDALEIRVVPGVADTVKNALVRTAPGRSERPYAVEVTVTNLTAPTNQYEQAGITWYQDGKPVFKLVKELVDGTVCIVPGKIPMDAQTVQLRLIVSAEGYTAQFRPGARGDFVTAAEGKLPPPGRDEVSIQCYNGPDNAEHWIRFDDFRIVEIDTPADAEKPAVVLPPDWRGTPVGSDGGVQYDPRGDQAFATRIVPSVAGGFTESVRQESELPAAPVVTTTNRRHQLECETLVYALPVSADPRPARLAIERVGNATILANWAQPQAPCDPAFAHIAVGWNEAINYRFRAEKGARYAVVFGLCEGYHWQSGQRPLDLKIEDQVRQRVDLVGEHGHNVPFAYAFDAADENGDGWINVTVAPVAGAPDTHTVLNMLWVFPADQCPPPAEIITGTHNDAALGYVPCGAGLPPDPRDDVLVLRLRAPATADITAVPTLVLETGSDLEPCPGETYVRIDANTSVTCFEPLTRVDKFPGRVVLVFPQRRISAGGETALLFGVHRGIGEYKGPATLDEAQRSRIEAPPRR